MSSTGPLLPYKVWSADGQIKKGLVATDFNDLEAKCRETFSVPTDQRLTFVLASDGTEVNYDYFTMLEANTVLIMLRPGENWGLQGPVQPPPVAVQQASTTAPSTWQQISAVSGKPCPNCGGPVKEEYSTVGIILAVIFFPLGILCCLFMKEWKCQGCQRTYANANLTQQEKYI